MPLHLSRRGALIGGLAAALGAPAARGAQEIVLGQIGPFTVIPVPDAAEVNQGIKAYLAEANKAGGVRGRKIGLFEMDDRYSADGFAEQFPKALLRKPLALLSPIGSAALKRMLDDKMLDTTDVIVVNAIPGAESLRNPGHPRLFHIRAGDRQQIDKIVAHTRILGMTRLSVLYQDLPVGVSGYSMAQEAAARLGGIELKAEQATTDAAALAVASRQIAGQSAQGVLVLGAPPFMANGVAALRAAGVTQSIFVLSYVPAKLIVKLAGKESARGVSISATFPNPNGSTLPLHRQFQAAMKAAFPKIDDYTPFHMEGYLTARTVVESLRRSKESEVSPAALARALRSAGELDFGGFSVNFSAGNAGSRFVDIGVIGSDGRLRY